MDDALPPRFSDAQIRALASVTLLWTTSLDGSIDERNLSWESYTGQSPAEYMGLGWLSALHPEDRDPARHAWQASVASHRPLAMFYRLRRRDGKFRWMRAEGTTVQTDGRAVGWIGACHDVTALREAEIALRRSEERLRFLDAFSQATRAPTDPAEVMAVAAQRLAEHLGTARCAYADVEDDNDTFTIRADWSAPGVPSSAGLYSLSLFGPQATSKMRQGTFLVVRDVAAELGDEGGGRMFRAIGIQAIICAPLVKAGRLVAMMAVHHAEPRHWLDSEVEIVGEVVERCWAHIERVRHAAKLKEQDQRKDEFLATLAHELRNPLAPMRYSVGILQRVAPGSAPALQAQSMIERQVATMGRLIDDLMDLSRINRGLIELRRERLDLREVLRQAVETSRPAVDAAGHALQVSLPASPLDVVGDATRLVQVVSNLLNNAAKYTPNGGRITLTGWQDEGRAWIEVADNGIGIPAGEHGRLFEVFAQLPHTAPRSHGGLGIGLALVKTLVQMHDGAVTARSPGLNAGSTFAIELPLAARVSDSALKASEGLDPPPAPQHGRQRVLVVEDNADGRTALVELLGLLGHEVQSAADGEEGLAAVLASPPQVALLDLGMPKMDGLALAREIRQRPQLAAVRLIALTGWGAPKDRHATAAAGFDHHLTKPVDLDQLQQLLAMADAPHQTAPSPGAG